MSLSVHDHRVCLQVIDSPTGALYRTPYQDRLHGVRGPQTPQPLPTRPLRTTLPLYPLGRSSTGRAPFQGYATGGRKVSSREDFRSPRRCLNLGVQTGFSEKPLPRTLKQNMFEEPTRTVYEVPGVTVFEIGPLHYSRPVRGPSLCYPDVPSVSSDSSPSSSTPPPTGVSVCDRRFSSEVNPPHSRSLRRYIPTTPCSILSPNFVTLTLLRRVKGRMLKYP